MERQWSDEEIALARAPGDQAAAAIEHERLEQEIARAGRYGTPEDLVGNADAALYKAKRAGKDRVESYD